MVGRSVGWLVGLLVGWLVDRLTDRSIYVGKFIVYNRLFSDYETVGCYKENKYHRAIPSLEGQDDVVLDGLYYLRKDPVAKCYLAALRQGYSVFAVANGGLCLSSDAAAVTYSKYGKSTACNDDGEGGKWANQVYIMK